MASSLNTVLFLFFCQLLSGSAADRQIKEITPQPGRDVTLPCEAPNNINITAVEWTRSDLKRYIYMKRDGHVDTTDQDPSYVNRVQLKDDEMKNGELSLILKNVNNKDGGRYVCGYVEETATQIKLISTVYLNVTDPQILVESGQTVALPCRAPRNAIIRGVEWVRSDLERYVYLKIDGRLVTADQDPSYVNRVQLKDDEMKNGELSLILKNVNNKDEGRYVCLCGEERGRRRKRDDQRKPISIVYLKVEDGDSRDGKDKPGHLEVILPVTLIAALVVVVGLVGLVGFMIYKKRRGRSEKKTDLPVHDPDVLQQL